MAQPVRDRSGFTLIELLVALVVSGLLVGVVFQLMQGQAQYVGLQSSREEVQQNARAAVELIGSELRSIPDSVGIIAASADSMSVRVPRVWGMICAVPSATTRSIRVPTVAGLSLAPTDSTQFAATAASVAQPWTNPVRVTGVAINAADCAAAPGSDVYRVSLSAIPQNASGIAAALGARAYLFDPVTYRIGSSASLGGLWIERRSGGNGNQPLAGPVLDDDDGPGLQFRYFAGNVEVGAPVAAASLPSSSRIEVLVRTVSRNGVGDQPREVEADTALISLRIRS